MSTRRLVVIGAGPVGLTAALLAASRGFDVTVLERDRIGASLRRWGGVRFFTPVSMNVDPLVAQMLEGEMPDADALLTGPQLVEQVLEPLCESEPLRGRVRCGHRVVAVGRAGLLRQDHPGHPIRAERPFRLLVETAQAEHWLEADAVLDAGGTFGNPTWLGSGGLPAKGERFAGQKIVRDLGELAARSPALEGQRILLVGHGHSAAHALLWLEGLASRGTTVTWALRSPNLWPVTDVASDPLPERSRTVAAANALARTPPPWLNVLRKCTVEGITPNGSSLSVALSGGRSAEIDTIVALTGYRPDLAPLSELAIDISPVTEGAAGLARALSCVTDCLSVPTLSPSDLASGERGFAMVGAKSYGRSRTFLLQTGYKQLRTILDSVGEGSTP